MPVYEYQCENGHKFDNFFTIVGHLRQLACHCGAMATQIISAPILIKAAPFVCYDSPIDGRPITTWAARREDLARNNCQPYDPEMRKDAERFNEDCMKEVESDIQQTVEQEFSKMSHAKRSQLGHELFDLNMSAEITRR